MTQVNMTKQISVSGISVSYLIAQSKAKSKKTLVFLHGWGGTKESWRKNIAGLSDHFDCIALDLPGFGQSSEPDKPWGVYEYASFLKEFVEKLGIKTPVIVGKSFGGRVAIVYSSSDPEKLSELILVSAAGIEERSLKTKLTVLISSFLGIVAGLLPGISRETLRQHGYKLLGLKEESVYKREVKKIVTNQDLRDLLPAILVKTLIVWGAEDKVLPIRLARMLQDGITNSSLKVIKKGDHWVHEKYAKQFNQLVIEFL